MSQTQETISPQPPANLPLDPRVFYSTPVGAKAVQLSAQPEPQHVLEQLGPPAFRKSSFPVVGFLASLYEHVAAHVSGENTP